MNNEQFFDWSDDLIAPPIKDKSALRAEIARQTEEFLANGGVIQKIPYDPIPEMVGAVGGSLKQHWPTEEGLTAALPTE